MYASISLSLYTYVYIYIYIYICLYTHIYTWPAARRSSRISAAGAGPRCCGPSWDSGAILYYTVLYHMRSYYELCYELYYTINYNIL